MHTKGGDLLLFGASAIFLVSLFSAGRLQQGPSASPVPQWQIDAGGSAKFDVASVKQDTAASGPQTTSSNIVLNVGDTFSPTGGLLSMTNYPLVVYIDFAYKIGDGRYEPQLPGWAKTNRYDIIARASVDTTKDQFRLMMQALLADRFKFAMHTETRQEKTIAMVLDKPGKLGPQLRQHTDPSDCSTANPYSLYDAQGVQPPTVAGPGYPESCGTILMSPRLKPIHPGQFRMGARNLPLTRLAAVLGNVGAGCGDRPVTDETGLTGLFDFVFEYARPARPTNDGTATPDADGPPCQEAVKQQLGLKLIPKTGPVDYFILDHIEEPSPN